MASQARYIDSQVFGLANAYDRIGSRLANASGLGSNRLSGLTTGSKAKQDVMHLQRHPVNSRQQTVVPSETV